MKKQIVRSSWFGVRSKIKKLNPVYTTNQELRTHYQSGQVLVLAIIIVAIISVTVVVLIGSSLTFNQSSKYSLEELQAINLAEAGIDKAVATFNTSGSNYNGESETIVGNGSFSVEITNKDASTKLIKATGYIPNKTNPKTTRSVQIELKNGEGASFVYGMQVGNGGITFGNGGTLNGSIYSNGNVNGGSGTIVNGDIWVAGGTQPTPDQEADCINPNCLDFIFGRNVSGNNQADVAQSFRPNVTATLNKISIKIKKIGNPASLSVRILGDSNGSPNKNNVITTGTLINSVVGTEYGFIDVTFSSAPLLNADTNYWIVLDGSISATNYWFWQYDSLQGYTRGEAKWSTNWQAGSPIWNNISGDLAFKTYSGGVSTYINLNNSSSRINGDAHANSLQNLTVTGSAYYQTFSNVIFSGPNYPNSSDPPPVSLPISDQNISEWKNDAQALGVQTGDINGAGSCNLTLGPGQIIGNITLGNGCTITVYSPLWVTGNITAGNSTIFKLHPNFGSGSGMIIVDGTTVFGNGGDIQGSGTAGSYLMLLSTHNSQSTGNKAFDMGNGSVSGIIYAPYGEVNLPNGANFRELIAWKIVLGNSAILNYQSGLSNVVFSAGPTGAYSVIKGTYQVK